MYQWKKNVAERNVDAWLERLAFVEPERLVVVALPSGRTQSLEVYYDTPEKVEALARQFGGRVREILPQDWQPTPVTVPGKPLSIAGGRLLITAQAEELVGLRRDNPRSDVLCVPAAMAFGTGEHATTAMCLRLLVETSRKLVVCGKKQGPWSVLDLGTGSGILALSASRLGAKTVLGLDHDPHAVRTARENALLNGTKRGVKFAQSDLLRSWGPVDPAASWTVVTANLFSNLLVALMEPMCRAVAPEGFLILSGILATQAAEVIAAVRAAGAEVRVQRRRGKWVALLVRRQVSQALA